jgi:chromosome segregation ATPase
MDTIIELQRKCAIYVNLINALKTRNNRNERLLNDQYMQEDSLRNDFKSAVEALESTAQELARLESRGTRIYIENALAQLYITRYKERIAALASRATTLDIDNSDDDLYDPYTTP